MDRGESRKQMWNTVSVVTQIKAHFRSGIMHTSKCRSLPILLHVNFAIEYNSILNGITSHCHLSNFMRIRHSRHTHTLANTRIIPICICVSISIHIQRALSSAIASLFLCVWVCRSLRFMHMFNWMLSCARIKFVLWLRRCKASDRHTKYRGDMRTESFPNNVAQY